MEKLNSVAYQTLQTSMDKMVKSSVHPKYNTIIDRAIDKLCRFLNIRRSLDPTTREEFLNNATKLFADYSDWYDMSPADFLARMNKSIYQNVNMKYNKDEEVIDLIKDLGMRIKDQFEEDGGEKGLGGYGTLLQTELQTPSSQGNGDVSEESPVFDSRPFDDSVKQIVEDLTRRYGAPHSVDITAELLRTKYKSVPEKEMAAELKKDVVKIFDEAKKNGVILQKNEIMESLYGSLAMLALERDLNREQFVHSVVRECVRVLDDRIEELLLDNDEVFVMADWGESTNEFISSTFGTGKSKNDPVQTGNEVGRESSGTVSVDEHPSLVENEMIELKKIEVQNDNQTIVKSNTPKYDEMSAKYTPSDKYVGVSRGLDSNREAMFECLKKLRDYELNGRSDLAEELGTQDEDQIDWTYAANMNVLCNQMVRMKQDEEELIKQVDVYLNQGFTLDDIRRLLGSQSDDGRETSFVFS